MGIVVMIKVWSIKPQCVAKFLYVCAVNIHLTRMSGTEMQHNVCLNAVIRPME